MRLYLISNNLVLDNIFYESDETVELKRINRPLSIEGEDLAKKLTKIIDADVIYSSCYASALATAKYLSQEKNIPINIDSDLDDSKIGDLGRKNIKMLRYMQERNFNYKFANGESLNDTKERLNNIIDKIIKNNKGLNVAIFTHKRAIMSYLLDYTSHGYNLDDRLILSFDDTVILDDASKDVDILVVDYDNGKITNISNIET